MQLDIRKYQPEDRQPLIDMTKENWGGHDHLPHHLDDWADDNKHHIYVGEIENKVVALSILRIMDNGLTGWMEGLRVHPDFRGRGYASQMSKKLIDKGQELGVERYRLTLAQHNKASTTIAKNLGLKPIVSNLALWLDPENIDTFDLERKDILTSISAKELLEQISEVKRLIPQNVLIRHWHAYDLVEQNLKFIENDAFQLAARGNTITGFIHMFSIKDTHGPALCAGFYCSDDGSFLSCLMHVINYIESMKFETALLIFDKKYRPLLHQFEWYEQEEHELELALYERKIA